VREECCAPSFSLPRCSFPLRSAEGHPLSALHLLSPGLRLFRRGGRARPPCVRWYFDRNGVATSRQDYAARKDLVMIETIAVVLIVLWLLGMVSSYTMDGLIHVLLVIAVITILLRVIQGRRLR